MLITLFFYNIVQNTIKEKDRTFFKNMPATREGKRAIFFP